MVMPKNAKNTMFFCNISRRCCSHKFVSLFMYPPPHTHTSSIELFIYNNLFLFTNQSFSCLAHFVMKPSVCYVLFTYAGSWGSDVHFLLFLCNWAILFSLPWLEPVWVCLKQYCAPTHGVASITENDNRLMSFYSKVFLFGTFLKQNWVLEMKVYLILE